MKDLIKKEEMNLTISCNAFFRITTPQMVKTKGHIKKKKVIVLIDSGSTHNFIHCKIAKELNYFLYLAPECQVMVASGGTINCSGKCYNIKISMGKCHNCTIMFVRGSHVEIIYFSRSPKILGQSFQGI